MITTEAPAVITPQRDTAALERHDVDYVLERMADAQKGDEAFKTAAMRHWQQIHNILPPDWPYYSRFFEPETQNACWDHIEGLMAAVFNKERPFDLIPVEDADEVQTEIMRTLMDYVLREKCFYKRNLFYMVQEAVFFGNGVIRHQAEAKPIRYSVPRQVYANDFAPVSVGVQWDKVNKTEIWPTMRVVSRFDCYPARTGGTIQEMPYFIERLIMPIDRIKALGRMAGWRNTDKLEGFMELDEIDGTASNGSDSQHWDLFARLAAIGYDVRTNGQELGGEHAVKYAELLVYSEGPADGDGCDKVKILGDRKWLLTDPEHDDNPYFHGMKSYSEIKFSPTNSQIWQAEGVPKLIECQQDKLNRRMSAIGDTIEDASKPMTLVNRNAGVDDLTQLQPYPRRVVEVNDVNGIKWRDPYRMGPDAWQDVMSTRAALQRSGGSLDLQKGIVGKNTGFGAGTETLGGIQTLLNAANAAKSFKWRLAEETGLKEGLNLTAGIIQQVLTVPQKIRIIGENKILSEAGFQQFLVVRPEDICCRWDFFAVGASNAIDNATQAELLARIVTGAMQLPEVGPRIKQIEVWTEGAELAGIRNPRRLLMSDEEFQQKQAAMPDPLEMMKAQAQIQIMIKLCESLDFKDADPFIRAQLEKLAGLQPSPAHVIEMQRLIKELLTAPTEAEKLEAGQEQKKLAA